MKWFKWTGGNDDPPAEDNCVGCEHRPVLNQRVLAEIISMERQGSSGLLRQVAAAYLDTLPRLVDQLRQAAVSDDYSQAYQAAHSLKSGSATLGAESLAARCQSIERLAKHGEDFAVEMTAFEQEWPRVENALRSLLSDVE